MIDPVSALPPALGSLAVSPVEPGAISSGAAPQSAGAGADFGSTLSSIARDAARTLKDAEQAAIAGIAGKMPAQQVVERVLAAERTVQTAIALRDKVVSALQEVSRLSI